MSVAAVAAAAKTPKLVAVQEKVDLPKHKSWGVYEEWLPLNINRIHLYHCMEH